MIFLMITSMISINLCSNLKRKCLENELYQENRCKIKCKNNLDRYNSKNLRDDPLHFSNNIELKNKSLNMKKQDITDLKIDEDLYYGEYNIVDDEFYKEEMKESKEIFDWLDQIEIQEQSIDKLNACSPVNMDFKTLKLLLTLKNHSKSNVIKNEIRGKKENQLKCKENSIACFDKDNNMNTENLDNLHDSSTDSCQEKNFIKTGNTKDFCKKKISDTFKTFISKFIDDNIGLCYKESFNERIKGLEEARIIFDRYKFNQERYNAIFKTSDDEKLFLKLKNITTTFDKNLKFNQKTCDKFTAEFDTQIFKVDEALHVYCLIDILSYDQKVILFYSEFFKFYKYIFVIPELLTLSRLFSIESCSKLIFNFHLINVFADKSDDLKQNRVIILCMIYKAFRVFNVNNLFDLFLIPKYDLICNKTRHNMNYFLWEINAKKRRDIKCRKINVCTQQSKDKKYLQVIFLTFLYQHMMFFDHFNNDTESFRSFQKIVERVKKTKSCFACLFDKYLTMFCKFDRKFNVM